MSPRPRPSFKSDLEAIIKREGSPFKAAEKIGVSYRTIRHWLTGFSAPRSRLILDRIERLARPK